MSSYRNHPPHMSTIEILLTSSQSLYSSTKTLKTKFNSSSESVCISSLGLVIKGELNKAILSDTMFSDIIKVDVVCSEQYIEKEEIIKTTYTIWGDNHVCQSGYDYYCRGFDVKLHFIDDESKNKFKLKRGVDKLISKIGNKYRTYYLS